MNAGVLGLGQLGTAIAERMVANGFRVHGWARSAKDIPGVTTHHGPDGLEDWDQALSFYQRAQKIAEDNPMVWNDLGLCYARRGQFEPVSR